MCPVRALFRLRQQANHLFLKEPFHFYHSLQMMRQSTEMIACPIHLRLPIHLLGMVGRLKKLKETSLPRSRVPKHWLNVSSNYLKILLTASPLRVNVNQIYGAQASSIRRSEISIHTYIRIYSYVTSFKTTSLFNDGRSLRFPYIRI